MEGSIFVEGLMVFAYGFSGTDGSAGGYQVKNWPPFSSRPLVIIYWAGIDHSPAIKGTYTIYRPIWMQ